MIKIWQYMQESGPYERHHLIAIVRAMARGHVHIDITLGEAAVSKLQSLGLTVVQLQGAYHRIAWADAGFVNDDPGYIPSEVEANQGVPLKKSKIVKVAEATKKPASNDDVWRNFINSMGSTLNTNKNGVGRVD